MINSLCTSLHGNGCLLRGRALPLLLALCRNYICCREPWSLMHPWFPHKNAAFSPLPGQTGQTFPSLVVLCRKWALLIWSDPSRGKHVDVWCILLRSPLVLSFMQIKEKLLQLTEKRKEMIDKWEDRWEWLRLSKDVLHLSLCSSRCSQKAGKFTFLFHWS